MYINVLQNVISNLVWRKYLYKIDFPNAPAEQLPRSTYGIPSDYLQKSYTYYSIFAQSDVSDLLKIYY